MPDNVHVLIREEEIRSAVSNLAHRLDAYYGGEHVHIIGIATGCIVFLSDLIRRLRMPVHIELIRARSYHGAATAPGRLDLDLWGLAPKDLRGRRILVVDDIFDTGRTLEAVVAALAGAGAADIRSAVLLEKPGRSAVDTRPDFVALRIPDRFVVGYGLDHDGRHRNLPFIGFLGSERRDPTG